MMKSGRNEFGTGQKEFGGRKFSVKAWIVIRLIDDSFTPRDPRIRNLDRSSAHEWGTLLPEYACSCAEPHRLSVDEFLALYPAVSREQIVTVLD
jgi:hypothetical protein